ncbi:MULTISPECIES: cysteine dioxygenase [Vibrio]|uniref:cysteine dioxygenase n=1 Tax=Vibrio TaxID=662 RepID=UPI003D0B3C65
MKQKNDSTPNPLTQAQDFKFTEKVIVPLNIHGQGVVLISKQKDCDLTYLDLCLGSEHRAVKLSITNQSTTLYGLTGQGDWSPLVSSDDSLDQDPLCQYWLSIDSNNAVIRYGKGEIRGNTVILEYGLENHQHYLKPDDVGNETQSWLKLVQSVDILASDNRLDSSVLNDPVTIDPPLFVASIDTISMDDIAFHQKTVIDNLPLACQQLYSNIAGKQFTLNTEAFPQFEQAINESILDKNGWCYKTLLNKIDEFGDDNPNETYLRITMGVNQGNSPGIPFVMEIWPSEHGSPIHNHGDANAIIRVLSGEITVNLFSMLSKFHSKPFATQTFKEGEITWISPGLNQTHQLRNIAPSGQACITIQCYQYSTANTQHYEYFDYLEPNGEIEQFTPNSDMGFLEFKSLMWQEWRQRHGA